MKISTYLDNKKKYKVSRYNLFLESKEDNTFLAFNAISGGFAYVKRGNYEIIQKILLSPNDYSLDTEEKKKLFETLLKGGFLYDENLNETHQILKVRHWATRMSHYVLSLTIAPTLECNFECKYCYEREKKIIKNITMGDAEEEKLLEFLTNKVSKIETLFITWYGGEPLLELNRIISLSNKMKQICKKNKCKFNAALITNGYLLHENILKNLENIGIKEIQVTLDGSPEIHNSFRPLKGGKPTFSIILQNIKSVVNTQKFNLVIRVNISKQNIHSYKVLLQILKEEGLKEKVQIYLGKIISESSSLASYCFDNFDYSVLEIDFLKSLLATDWNIKLPSLTKNTYCMANTLSGYGIDPKLNVYKCWEVIGKEEFKIGVIDEGKIKFNENLFHWLSDDVFNEKKCRNCKILPLCMGGCLARKMIAGERECITFKYSLSKKLILFEQFYHKSKNPK